MSKEMREFRLKKWYPSLPENWKGKDIYVVEREYGFELHPSIKDELTEDRLRFREVYNNDFWEEVKPITKSSYEIISFKTSCGIISRNDNFWSNAEGAFYTNKGVSIHSVKRLIDESVFTVGDVIKHNTGIIDTIKGIHKSGNNIFLSGEGNTSKFSFALSLVELLRLSKKDEVGKPIYEGENYYKVFTNLTYSLHIAGYPFSNSYAGAKFFKEKKDAEKYILENKKVLSMQDVLDYLKSKNMEVNEVDPDFIQFVKDKQ